MSGANDGTRVSVGAVSARGRAWAGSAPERGVDFREAAFFVAGFDSAADGFGAERLDVDFFLEFIRRPEKAGRKTP